MLNPTARALLLGSFTEYAKYMIPLFNNEYHWSWHHYAVCAEYEQILADGKGTLLLSMHPQSGKSSLTNLFISYYLGKYPNRSVIYCTYNANRAEAFTKNDLMNIIFDVKYKELFPHIQLKYDLDERENSNKNKYLRKKASLTDTGFSFIGYRGRFMAAGMGQGIAGTPAHLAVVDDALASKEAAMSEIIVAKTLKWIKYDVLSRCQPNATKVFINTRWSTRDPIGYMLEEYEKNKGKPNYPVPRYLNFPAQLEAWHERNQYDKRNVGEFLWEVYSEKYAIAMSDEEEWLSLYQGEPMDTRGIVLKAEHIRYYDQPIRPFMPYISIDANFKAESEKGDAAAITVWVHKRPYKYLVDGVIAKIDFLQLLEVVQQVIKKYPDYAAIIIEEKANGRALYEMLRKKFPRCVTYNVGTNSKMERFQWCLPEFIAGNIWLPTPQLLPIVGEVKRQLLSFSGAKGAKDDAVDSTSQFLNWLREHSYNLVGSSANFIDGNGDTINAGFNKQLITDGLAAVNVDIRSLLDG